MEEISSIFSTGINYIRYIRIADIVDILLVAYLIYKAIWFVRKTNSHNLARGILLLLFVLLASYLKKSHGTGTYRAGCSVPAGTAAPPGTFRQKFF